MLRDTFVQFVACLAIALAVGVAVSPIVMLGRCMGSLPPGTVLLACDVDGNGIVDRADIQLIADARGTTPRRNDPRDVDLDGMITVLDNRACALNCTYALCASQAMSQQ
jgi:hypothetical protein